MSFSQRVTTTKRNHIYLGTTDSRKVATTLEETYVDLNNVYNRFSTQDTEIAALASGYLDEDGRLRELSVKISEIEDEFNMMTYIHATQDPIY